MSLVEYIPDYTKIPDKNDKILWSEEFLHSIFYSASTPINLSVSLVNSILQKPCPITI